MNVQTVVVEDQEPWIVVRRKCLQNNVKAQLPQLMPTTNHRERKRINIFKYSFSVFIDDIQTAKPRNFLRFGII